MKSLYSINKNINLNILVITNMEVDDILLVRTDPDSDKSTLSYVEKKWIEHIYGEIPVHPLVSTSVGRDKVLKASLSVDEDIRPSDDPPTLATAKQSTEDALPPSGERTSVVGNNNYIRIAVLTAVFLGLHLVRLPTKFDNIGTRTIIFVAMAIVVFNII